MVLASVLCAQLVAAAPAPAADTVVITPDIVEIPGDRSFGDLSVENPGPTAREVRLAALSWTQDEAARVTLAPAEDASVFPERAVVRPGEVRRFRLSTWSPPGERERAYRISIVVLDAAAQVAVNAVIPAFVAPRDRRLDAALGVTCEQPRACRVVIANRGTVRFRPQRITLGVPDDDADPVVIEPWWVLAGGARVHDVALAARPRGEVVVRVVLDGGELVARTIPSGEREVPR